MAYSTEMSIDRVERGMTNFQKPEQLEEAIREQLPKALRSKPFRVDLAAQDPRPLNPMAQSNKRINIYNPSTDMISPEPLKDVFRYIPARVVQFRVFALDLRYHAELALAAERVFDPAVSESCPTNI